MSRGDTAQEATQELIIELNEISQLVNKIPDIIYLLDQAGEISWVSDAVKELGYEPEGIVGRNILEVICPLDKEKAAYRINERRTGKRSTRNLELRFLRKNAAVQAELECVLECPSFIVSAQGIYSSGELEVKTFHGTLGSARDITQYKKRYKEIERKQKLLNSSKKLNSFSGRVLSDSEMEKRELSQNMHDELGSLSVGLNTALQLIEQAIKERNYNEAHYSIQRAKTFLKEALKNCKKIVYNLNPYKLEIVGLHSVLNNFFIDIAETTGIRIKFKHNLKGRRPHYKAAICLYRIAQEAVSNAILHGVAKSINVRLCIISNLLCFFLVDDGRGFVVKKVLDEEGSLKMGIKGMTERVAFLGGDFTITSSPGRGTEIALYVSDWE